MRIANRTWLLGVAAAAVLAFAVPVVAETTVLEMAQKQNDTLQATVASTQPQVPEITPPSMPAVNTPAVAVPLAVATPTAPTTEAVPAPIAPAAPIAAAVPAAATSTPTQGTSSPVAVAVAPTAGEAKPAEAAADAKPVTLTEKTVVPEDKVKLDDENRTGSGDKVPPQVTAVVEKLRGAKVDLSLEDMNQARAALARLDLLLELEQKMHDLQQARTKNDAGSMSADISGMLPTQVAAMGRRGNMPVLPVTPVAAADLAPVMKPVMKPTALPPQYEIQRINGINGEYSAVVRSRLDSKTSTVRVGDTLSDGTEVLAITPSSIKLRDPGEGKVSTVKIENVSNVSGRRTY